MRWLYDNPWIRGCLLARLTPSLVAQENPMVWKLSAGMNVVTTMLHGSVAPVSLSLPGQIVERDKPPTSGIMIYTVWDSVSKQNIDVRMYYNNKDPILLQNM